MTPQPPSDEKLPDILVVDDTPANLQLLSRMLKAWGYKARLVTSGALALQAAKSEQPDLILLDIHMPEMNGYKVCDCLKADDALKDIPVIFISALGEIEDKVKAFEHGGVDYITKPFRIEEVLARVKTHLRLRQLQLELATHNARLEEAVATRTREITEARDQLAEANKRLGILDKAKSDFLSLISHELRTPLNGLLGITDMILDECKSLSSMEAICEHFNHSRDRILTIVSDALLLTQIDVETERFSRAPTSLSLALLNAKEHSMELAKSCNVDIGAFPILSELVIGEIELLTKALEALFETAVHFSAPGNVITLSISNSDKEVLLRIETKGRRIPEKYLSQFFDVLAIAEAVVPGGDLGLRPAVAERIISLFDGSVTVENLDPAGIQLNVRLKLGR